MDEPISVQARLQAADEPDRALPWAGRTAESNFTVHLKRYMAITAAVGS